MAYSPKSDRRLMMPGVNDSGCVFLILLSPVLERESESFWESEVDQILRKEHIKGPVQGHKDFLLESREFH